MEYRYITKGVCSNEMIFQIEGNIIKSLEIVGGCRGKCLKTSIVIIR